MAETFISGGGRFKRPEQRWYEQEGPEMARCLVDTVRYVEERQAAIQDAHRRHAEIALGYVPVGMDWSTVAVVTRPQVQATKNIIRSVCDTATALIGKVQPKPSIVTDGGDWEIQQQARDLDRFLVGAYSRAHVYRSAQTTFHGSTVFGTSAYRLVERGSGEDYWIDTVPVLISDIVVSEHECENGDTTPENFYYRRCIDVDKAIKLWAGDDDEKAKAIRDAAGKTPMTWPGRTVPREKVVVVEGWHLPGCYCVAIDGTLLKTEPWEFDWAPFVVMHWSPPVSGFYGDGVAYRQYGRQRRINYLYRWIQRCQDLIAVPRVWVNSTNGPLKVQISNEIGEIVSVRDKPVFQTPEAVSAEIYAWLEALDRGGFEDEGISQASAANRLPPGIESAPAQREYAFKEGARFAPVSQRFEDSVARETAYKMIALYKRASKRGARPQVAWADRKLQETIDWERVDMDTRRYEIRVEASSLESLSPAGRLQAAIELAQTGWIPPDEGRRLLGHPDLERNNQLATSGREHAEWVAWKLLKGDKVAVNPYADLATQMETVTAVMLNAERGGAPRRLIDNLRNYLRDLDAEMHPGGLLPPAPPGVENPASAVPPGMEGAGLGAGAAPVPSISIPAASGAIPLQGTPIPGV